MGRGKIKTMEKTNFTKQLMAIFLCMVLVLTTISIFKGEENIVFAIETDNEENRVYTVQDFLAYMQHGYEEYNIFYQYPWSPDTLFTTDETCYEYRQIDSDTVNVTGKIAVICNPGDDVDSEVVESNLEGEVDESTEGEISEEDETTEDEGTENDISDYARITYEIKKDETAFIERIYKGSHLPEELLLTYVCADTLDVSDLGDYDLYIFEKSSRDAGISEETFMHLDKILKKEGATFVYDGEITAYTHELAK